MSGGLLQLVAKGNQDSYLTGTPQFTYFKLIYKKYINFAIKQRKNIFDAGQPEFGKNNITLTIDKEGDLINNLIFKTTITSTSDQILGKWNYVRNIGFVLIKKIQLKIGTIIIDTIYGDWLCVWKELFNTKEKQLLLDKMIGNNEKALTFDSNNKNLDLYIPIPFFFTNNLALPIVNLIHDVSLIFEFRDADTLINKQPFYFDIDNSISSNPDISDQTYNVSLTMSKSYILIDNILLDTNEKYKLIQSDSDNLIEIHHFQENIIDFHDSTPKKEVFMNHPTKFISFVIQPGGVLSGKTYLAYPGKNFFILAAKRFCLRYCATGWVGNNDFLLPYAKYGVFQNDSGESINGIGYNIAFDHGLTSLKSTGSFTEQEKIIYNLFIKLNPIIIKYYGNDKISTTIDNIRVDISNLTEEDKYILSLPCEEIDNFIISGGNQSSIHTGDNNNEGNPSYDVQVFDYSLYSTLLDGNNSLINSLDFELNSKKRIKEFDIEYFSYMEPYKYNLSTTNDCINIYSFSLKPNEFVPSGTINFSRINNFHSLINLKLSNPNISNLVYDLESQIIKNNSKILFMTKYYNILSIKNGIGILKYS